MDLKRAAGHSATLQKNAPASTSDQRNRPQQAADHGRHRAGSGRRIRHVDRNVDRHALASELTPLAQSQFQSVRLLESGLEPEKFLEYFPLGIAGLEMAVRNTSNKDTFQRRVANAVRLIAESDKQHNDPIALSLCVTAIDALLGRKGAEMTSKLADSVAELLEPKVDMRRYAATYVEKLYNDRSRVLHGDRLEGNAQLRKEARQLAASVLYGVWSYQDFFERFYDGIPKPEDFFKKLRDDFVKPGLQAGLIELPVRKLWQGNSNDHPA